MEVAGQQRPKLGWAWGLVILGVCGLLILVLGQYPILKWRERESVKVQKQRGWICRTVVELRQVGPPPADLGQPSSYYPWITSKHLIFSNGWAAYKIHTHHEDRLIGDVALLRLSDGRIYSSRHHYCGGGLTRLMLFVEGNLPQPIDANEFLNERAKRQEWNLISPDGRAMCSVFNPSSTKAEKSLWVSIGEYDGNSETNFLVRRYTFSGDYLGWATHWNSGDDLSVDVFTYARNPLAEYPKERIVPTNFLTTLKFHQDKRTGRFNDGQR